MQFSVRIKGIDRPHGFKVDVRRRFSWMEASLQFDSLSSQLEDHLRVSLSRQVPQFETSMVTLTSRGVEYRSVPRLGTLDGPRERIMLSSRLQLDSQSSIWEAERLSALSILLPIVQLLDDSGEEEPSDVLSPEMYDEEGQVSYGWSRRYERSQANRALAIEIHGRTCSVCGVNFDDCYGALARGYVEIHHLVPVSSMNGPQVVDPRTDLVPLCANCHRMAHRRWPPYTPSELHASRFPDS